MIGKDSVQPLGGFSMRFFRFEPQPDVNSFYDQDIVL